MQPSKILIVFNHLKIAVKSLNFSFQEVFSLMVKVYKADPHIRDNAGKKPRQYMVAHDQVSFK